MTGAIPPFAQRHPLIGIRGPNRVLPTWQEWLTLPSKVLKQRYDMSADDREAVIGHRRAFRSAWVVTLGCWGGAASKERLLSLVEDGTTDGSLASFKNAWKLRLPSRRDKSAPSPMIPCFLVQELLSHRSNRYLGSGPRGVVNWRRVAADAGVLPIEAVLYDFIFHELQVASDLPPSRILTMRQQTRADLWNQVGVPVSPLALLSGGASLAPDAAEILQAREALLEV